MKRTYDFVYMLEYDVRCIGGGDNGTGWRSLLGGALDADFAAVHFFFRNESSMDPRWSDLTTNICSSTGDPTLSTSSLTTSSSRLGIDSSSMTMGAFFPLTGFSNRFLTRVDRDYFGKVTAYCEFYFLALCREMKMKAVEMGERFERFDRNFICVDEFLCANRGSKTKQTQSHTSTSRIIEPIRPPLLVHPVHRWAEYRSWFPNQCHCHLADLHNTTYHERRLCIDTLYSMGLIWTFVAKLSPVSPPLTLSVLVASFVFGYIRLL